MITKNDCLTLLVSLEDKGVDIDNQMKRLLSTREIPMDVLKFILEHRGIEVANFYEMLRKKHNQKKSPLYHNIVKDITDVDDVITTLACLLVQITLYSNKLQSNRDIFCLTRSSLISISCITVEIANLLHSEKSSKVICCTATSSNTRCGSSLSA